MNPKAEYQRHLIEGMPCDCGRPATHWMNGPECDECKAKNQAQSARTRRLGSGYSDCDLRKIVNEVDRKYRLWLNRRGLPAPTRETFLFGKSVE